MRVALLTNFVAPYRIPLLRALAERVGELRIFVSTPMEANRNWPADDGGLPIELQRTWTFRQRWRHPHGFEEDTYVHVPLDTQRRLRNFRPDVVFSGELGLRSLGAALYARTHPGVALVAWLTLSDVTEQGRGALRGTLRRGLFRRFDAVVVNGEGGARYCRRFGLSDERIFRAPQTSLIGALAAIEAERPAAAARRLLYAGRLIPLKGLLPFIERLSHWVEAHPGERVEFRLAGDGPLAGTIRRHPLPPGLELRLLGEVPIDAMAAVYREADLFVFPSLADEWGLVVNEALASGLPVLGSRYSQAVEELVEPGREGWVFDPLAADDIDRALDAALGCERDRLRTMRSAARRKALALTPEYVADRIADALRFAQQRHRVR